MIRMTYPTRAAAIEGFTFYATYVNPADTLCLVGNVLTHRFGDE